MSYWIKSSYDVTKFKFNERREADIKDIVNHNAAIIKECELNCYSNDKEALRIFSGDLEDSKTIYHALKDGNIEVACKLYSNLDTYVRDGFPQWLAELAGAQINPEYYKFENSLEGTEE